MNSIAKLARLPAFVIKQRGIQTSVKLSASSSPQEKLPTWQQNFDPNNYSVPLRLATMDDCMEPYGSWKIAYAREKKKANLHLLKGIVMFTTTLCIFYFSGTADSLFMPNLDNIMEDTEPFNLDTEDRISVKPDDVE